MSAAIIWRAARTALQNYLRNFWLTLATVFMLVLALLVMNVLITLHFLSNEAVGFLQNHVAVSIYLKPETSPDQATNFKATIKNLPYVTEVNLLTKDEALERFKKLHRDNPVLLESLQELDSNPLGDSLEVKTKTIGDYTPLLAFVQQAEWQKIVADKDFRNYQDLVERLQNFTERFRTVGLFVLGFFLLISMLVIINTVRIALYARREEIGIMKLVGASNLFIRIPFLLETIFQVVTAMIVQTILLATIFHLAKPTWIQIFGGQLTDPGSYFWSQGLLFLGSEFLLLLLLTIVSSFWATHRYLQA